MLAYLIGIKNACSLPPISLSGGLKSNNRELKQKQENARGFPRVRSNVYCLISLAYAQPLIVSFFYFKFFYQVWMWEGLFLFFCFLFIIVGLVTGQLSFSDKPLWFFLLNLLRDLAPE